jgi:hypothetical protein
VAGFWIERAEQCRHKRPIRVIAEHTIAGTKKLGRTPGTALDLALPI